MQSKNTIVIQKTMMMKQLVTTILLFLSLSSSGIDDPRIGDKIYDLSFNKIMNYEKKSAKLSDFDEKIIVLNFWATWCGSCIKSLPKLEEIQNKFKNDLQILTITHDSEERIKQFLNNQDLSLPIVIDEHKEISSVFPHRSIPHTIVIDEYGIIRAITTSSEITEDLINNVINNKDVKIEEKKDAINSDPSKPLSENNDITYQVTITPYKEGQPSYASIIGDGQYENRRIIATNLNPAQLFELAYQFPTKTRTVVEVSDKSKFDWETQNLICFDLIVPEDLAKKKFDIMQQQLSFYFGYEVIIEERVKPVKILQEIPGTKNELREACENTEASFHSGGGVFSMKNYEIDFFVNFIENRINMPVVNNTNLDSKYDLEIPWYNENPGQIHDELKKIGLELIEEKRKIEVLVIKDK